MSLAKLNEMAEERFREIKRSKDYDIRKDFNREDFERPIPKVIRDDKPKHINEELEELHKEAKDNNIKWEVKDWTDEETFKVQVLDAGNILDFVDSLEVPNNIKRAICNLISIGDKEDVNKLDLLEKTIELLKEGVI